MNYKDSTDKLYEQHRLTEWLNKNCPMMGFFNLRDSKKLAGRLALPVVGIFGYNPNMG